jgi:aldehyde:ferredoxin oxidoreductase
MAKFFGYSGKILHVNLTGGEIEAKDLDAELAKKFIGGLGVVLRLAYDLMESGVDPLSPSNVLVMGAGPLAGAFPLATRFSLVTKEPMTNAIAFNNCGMALGRRLKAAGYDCLVVTGRADKPVYLKIFEDDVEILDASHLWGKDISETTDKLWEKHGREYSIIPIGQAGENHVALAITYVDMLSHLGKGGLGAVMGSKNLKAIAFGGTKRVIVSDPEKLRELTGSILTNCMRDYYTHTEPLDLVYQYTETFVGSDTRLYKNRTEVFPSKKYIEAPTGAITWMQKIWANKIGYTRFGCPGCVIPCKSRWEIKDGKYKGITLYAHGGKYKGAGPPGGKAEDIVIRCVPDATVEEFIYLLDLCNRYGICIQAFSPTMDLAVDLYERRIITKEHTSGMVLKRDFDTFLKLIEQIAFRKGFGSVLSDGTSGLIRKFPEGAKYSMDIKGIDTQFDPRTMGLDSAKFGQLTNPEGGCIEPAYSAKYLYTYSKLRQYCERVAVPRKTMDRILEKPAYNLSRLTPYAEDMHVVLSSFDICELYTPYWEIFNYPMFAELYTAATGIKTTPTQIKDAGERIWNLYKALNVREGFGRKDDRPPAKWFEPYKAETGELIPLVNATIGAAKPDVLTPDDLERLLDDYYDERGWDVKRGIPSKEKLQSLGLEFILEDFGKLGILK